MIRRIHVVADDYGLSPGVDDAILHLIGLGRLSGTGCMTLFDDWARAAARIAPSADSAALGLHLCLTDQVPLAGASGLAAGGRLPPLGRLARACVLGTVADADVFRELDAQLDRFEQALGRSPAYIDGHQHIHFLPPVRRWLVRLARRRAALPWLRGSPPWPRPGTPVMAKIAIVRSMALGFDQAMRGEGFLVRGPLSGFYDWTRPEAFAPALEAALATLPDGTVLMCHPGHVDAVLRSRDRLLDARETELAVLSAERFEKDMMRAGAAIARPAHPQPGLAAPAGDT